MKPKLTILALALLGLPWLVPFSAQLHAVEGEFHIRSHPYLKGIANPFSKYWRWCISGVILVVE